jgi:hypothetical protein
VPVKLKWPNDICTILSRTIHFIDNFWLEQTHKIPQSQAKKNI